MPGRPKSARGQRGSRSRKSEARRGGRSVALKAGAEVRGYVIQTLLGGDRMVFEFSAEHKDLGVRAVLKQYLLESPDKHSDDASDEGVSVASRRDAFFSWARPLVELKGTAGLISHLRCSSSDASAFLVTEHVEWSSLDDLLRAKRSAGQALGEAELLALVRPLLEGLREAHVRGMLHGAIRPANVRVRDSDLRPKLTGFRWSHAHGGLEEPVGDAYEAPETALSTELTAAADVYSLGALMWSIVAHGNPLIESTEPVLAGHRMHAVIRGEADPLEPARSIGVGRFSEQVLATIDRCLNLKESERIRDCGDLAETLPGTDRKDAGSVFSSVASGVPVPEKKDTGAVRTSRQTQARASERPQGLADRIASTVGVKLSPRKKALGGLACVGVVLGVLAGTTVRIAQGPPTTVPRLAGFVIEVEPDTATARFPEIQAEYETGMALLEGEYQLEVSAEGYESRTISVTHEVGGPVQSVALQPIQTETAPGMQSFTVTAEPASARVRLLDTDQEFEPGMSLPQGRYRVEVSAAGYRTEVLSLLHGTEPTNEHVQLRRSEVPRATASFTVEAQPSSASIRVLDIQQPYRPGMSLAEGRYRVEVSAEGYSSVIRLLQHGPGPSMHRVQLSSNTSSFTVTAVPSGALVKLLDSDRAYERGMALAHGQYRVEVSAEGYETVVRAVPHSGTTNEEVVLTALWSIPASMEFVAIPPGEFMMGSDASDAYEDERPTTRVKISRGFEITKHEVTQSQWQEVMGSNPSSFANCGPECPVENVSWHDVQSFLERLAAADPAATYRLPSEAEWEYAARGGAAVSGVVELELVAWSVENSGGQTQPVGGKRPNAFGLHDTVGNVWEWVQDRYGAYGGGAVTDPSGAVTGLKRVVRGGGWNDAQALCRPTTRNSLRPNAYGRQVGFRVVRNR